ncbi:hypothetical protein EBR57_05420, partial [bacterium]|nr:hypothetical protein [bacterium]
MTGTVHLYLTPEGWLTPEIDSLIRSLIETSPDDVAIIVSTSELKQVLVHHTTSDATIQAFPHISTLDDWVVGASGISVRRGPLLDAAARALALSRLESSHPELISFLMLTGIWNRLITLANLAVMHTLPTATLDRIAHQWFPSVNRINIRSVIATIQEARDEIGIRDQLFAYRYGQREQWRPLQRGGSSTLVFLGFTDPLPAERDVLRTLISAHPFSVVVVPDTTYPSDGTRDWMALLRAFPHVQEIDIRAARVTPALTVWQPETSDDEIALLVQLIRSAGTPDVGIALAQFDALHVPLATALGQAGIPVASALGTPLGDTLPGRMVAATTAAISGGFRVRDVLDWLDTRRHCPKPCGYNVADLVTTHNRLIQQGILDIDPWPSGAAHSEWVPDVWTVTQELLGQTIDTIGTFARTLEHPNRSHWNPSATREWGAVFQLIGEWETIRPSLPIDTQLSVLLEGLRGTKSPSELTTGIRICSLQHAAMVPADIWIVPSATDSSFPPPDHSLGNVTLPGDPAIPTIDMRVNAHQRWIHWLLGQTRRDLHICGPRTIAGEPQVISGAVTTALATA